LARPRASGLNFRTPAVSDTSVSRAIELRVRYAETDQMGVVYHANYLAWCEVGRTEYIRAGGMSYADMERLGFGLAVAEASIRFHAPARYDDRVRVETTLTDVRSRTVTFDYVIANVETGARLVTARTTLVSLDAAGRSAKLDASVRELLEHARR
jgi:acyl-CoA thioester hydrolase